MRLLAVSFVILVVLVTGACCLESPVLEWSSERVAFWVEQKVESPKLAARVRQLGVDGPTLMLLNASVLEETFLDYDGLPHEQFHVFCKFVEELKHTCFCPESVQDFWSFLEAYPDDVWFTGSLMLFTPRIGLLYTCFTDSARLALTGSSLGILGILALFGCVVFAPRGYLVLLMVVHWFSNPLVWSVIILFCCIVELESISLAYQVFKGKRSVGSLFDWKTLIPCGTFVSSYVFPTSIRFVGIVVFILVAALADWIVICEVFSLIKSHVETPQDQPETNNGSSDNA